MLEKHVKAALKKRLQELGAYYFMPVQTGIGSRTLDFLVCYQGRFFAIETKRPGLTMTPQQRLIAETIQAAGGVTLVVDTVEQAKRLILL